MSSTVIEELIVKLGLNAKDFKKVQKEVIKDFKQTRSESEKTAKDLEKDGQKAEEFYKKLRNGALKFFSVLTIGKGLINFTKDVINSGTQLDRMSNRLGVSADRMSRWTAAVKVNGGTAEEFLGTLKNLSASLTEVKLGGGDDFKQWLNILHVGLKNADGSVKTTEQLLGDLGQALSGVPKQDAYNFAAKLGIDEGTANLLMQGREAVEKLLAAQKPYNDKDAKSAREASEKLQQATVDLERTMMKLVPLVARLVPAIEKLVDWLVPAIEKTIGGVESAITFSSGVSKGGGGSEAGGSPLDFFRNKNLGLGGAPNKTSPIKSDTAAKFSAAEKASGLPPGTLSAIMKQEVGNRQDFIDDPSKYHYEMDKNGKRKSSAFGWFGILDSTAKDPGYGISPMKDKSVDEQIRFASQYAAALIKNSGGDVKKGLARYGEGEKYANSVTANMQMSRLSNDKSGGVTIVIGENKVYTQATDPNGVVRAFKSDMVRQADSGVR